MFVNRVQPRPSHLDLKDDRPMVPAAVKVHEVLSGDAVLNGDSLEAYRSLKDEDRRRIEMLPAEPATLQTESLDLSRWREAPSTDLNFFLPGANPVTRAQLQRTAHPLETGILPASQLRDKKQDPPLSSIARIHALASSTNDVPEDYRYDFPIDDPDDLKSALFNDHYKRDWNTNITAKSEDFGRHALLDPSIRMMLDPCLLRPESTPEYPIAKWSLQEFLLSERNSTEVLNALSSKLNLKRSDKNLKRGPLSCVIGRSLAIRYYTFVKGTESEHLGRVGYELPSRAKSINESFASQLHKELRNCELHNRYSAAVRNMSIVPIRASSDEIVGDWRFLKQRTHHLQESLPTRHIYSMGTSNFERWAKTYETTGIWYGDPKDRPKGKWVPGIKINK